MVERLLILANDPISIFTCECETVHHNSLTATQNRPQASGVEFLGQAVIDKHVWENINLKFQTEDESVGFLVLELFALELVIYFFSRLSKRFGKRPTAKSAMISRIAGMRWVRLMSTAVTVDFTDGPWKMFR